MIFSRIMWGMMKDLVLNGVLITTGKAAPVDGTTGKNICSRGSLYIDGNTGFVWVNTGTRTFPSWVKVGTQA